MKNINIYYSILLIITSCNLVACKDKGTNYTQPVWIKFKDFQITQSETTVGQYHQCYLAGKCKLPPNEDKCTYSWPSPNRYPINCVTWHDADNYCKYISARLPTETEWEFAATNQGEPILYPWGDTPAPNCDLAVIDDNGRGCGRRNLWPVCSIVKGNTKQGVCDMAGNAWEWTDSDYDKQLSPDKKVARGGGISSINIYTTKIRKGYEKDFYYGGLSFRCVK